MNITILGTGTSIGVPMIGCHCKVCLSSNPKDKRLRSSIFLNCSNKNILIDCGPDIRTQLLLNNITNIDFVLLTHEHNDHVIGLDDLRPICYLQNKCIPILAEQRVLDSIKTRFPYLFEANRFGNVAFKGIPILPGKQIYNYVEFMAIRINHGNLAILGFKFDKSAYITDASDIPPGSLQLLKKLDILIINALQINAHHKHLALSETLEIIDKLKPQQTLLTHMSHKIGLHKNLMDQLKSTINPAYDGQNIVL